MTLKEISLAEANAKLELYGGEKYELIEPVPDYFVRPYPVKRDAEEMAKRVFICRIEDRTGRNEAQPSCCDYYVVPPRPDDPQYQTLITVYRRANGYRLHQLPMVDGWPEMGFGLPASWDHDTARAFVEGGEAGVKQHLRRLTNDPPTRN